MCQTLMGTTGRHIHMLILCSSGAQKYGLFPFIIGGSLPRNFYTTAANVGTTAEITPLSKTYIHTMNPFTI